MERIKVLWTGGWDSTFRIVELSRRKVIIEPIYVIDDGRISVDYELKAMNNIIDVLMKKKKTLAKIEPITFINKKDIPENEDITKAYEIIRNITNLGSQHEWLARLAYVNPGLEIGTEAGSKEVSHIIHAIEDFGVLEFDGEIGYLNKEKSTPEGVLVFGNLRFPIIKKTERDMLKLIREWKYEDVMENIWFCHAPLKGEPCGMCHPCQVKIESDMEFLLPKIALKKYKLYFYLSRVFGKRIAGKINHLYLKVLYKIDRGKRS